MEILNALATDLKKENKELYVILNFDEMAIRKHVTWSESEKKFLGFINYGKVDCDEHLPIASNSIVFMINGINETFNIPVTYYFINALDTTEKMFLVLTIIKAITEIGVSIAMLTFDGLSTNISAMELLGACFRLNDMKPYIRNPVNDKKIFIMLDPPHMIKLMRNYIGSCKEMFDQEGRSIEWKFYENLEAIRKSKEFVTHKLTNRHINYEEKKMKVVLATQLFSRSVALSMEHLRDSNHDDFVGCEGTTL